MNNFHSSDPVISKLYLFSKIKFMAILIVSFNGMCLNRLVTSKETKNLSFKLTLFISLTKVNESCEHILQIFLYSYISF